jgi:uncharacterized protein
MGPMDPARYLVSDLLARPGNHRDERVDVAVTLHSDTIEVDDVAEADLRLEAAVGAVVVRGRASVPGTFTCSRCLQEFSSELSADVVATYGNDEDEDSRPISGDGRIDLAEAVRDELAMAMPPSPLCRPDCRGLCAECGTDLNTEPCGGHEDRSSSPFAALEGFFPSE